MQSALSDKLSLKAMLIAWLAGGTVFLLSSLILMPLVLGINAEVILRYMASLLLGPDSLLNDGAEGLIIGVLVHYALSLIFSLLIILVIFRWGLIIGILGGALLGLALYAINLYTLTLLFEWFFAANNVVLLVSHLLFGATVGGVYELLDDYDTPLLQERAS